MTLYIDGSQHILGRLGSIVAKKLLNGEEVVIVNAEKILIVGEKDTILEKYKTRVNLTAKGNPHRGPKFPRMADRIVRRAIRGMLPFKRRRGREALKRLKVFIGIPNELKEKSFKKIPEAILKGEKDFMLVEELSKHLGK
mgnify:CR=1 FL=1